MSERSPVTPITISQGAIESVLEYAIFLIDTLGDVAS